MDTVHDLKIVSWNVNSLKERTNDVHYYVNKYNVDVVLLQETGDVKGNILTLSTHVKYQLLSDKGIRGTAMYVKKKSVPSQLIEEPHKTDGVESVSVRLFLREGTLNVVNLYVSKNSFSITRLPDTVFTDTTLVAGDLNARHANLETSGKTNDNGRRLIQFLNDLQ